MNIKVLVADSSEAVCQMLVKMINKQKNMDVVGIATDLYSARELIKSRQPDVLTLSVEFPKMNGLDFLDKIMTLRPFPVIIVSKLAGESSVVCQRAKKIGASSCILKPKFELLESISDELISKINNAPADFLKLKKSLPIKKIQPTSRLENEHHLIAVGASTGGTEAITVFLKKMPKNCPGIVITQHMPKGFTASFATRLESLCSIKVCEARHNELIKAGTAYIAPGDRHLLVLKKSGLYYTVLSDEAPVNLHKPAIDLLFESVAHNLKGLGVGVLLTGMGKDGAAGLLTMKQQGAKTFAQDEATSVVYGMPKEAVRLGGVDHQLPLEELMPSVLEYLSN